MDQPIPKLPSSPGPSSLMRVYVRVCCHVVFRVADAETAQTAQHAYLMRPSGQSCRSETTTAHGNLTIRAHEQGREQARCFQRFPRTTPRAWICFVAVARIRIPVPERKKHRGAEYVQPNQTTPEKEKERIIKKEESIFFFSMGDTEFFPA